MVDWQKAIVGFVLALGFIIVAWGVSQTIFDSGDKTIEETEENLTGNIDCTMVNQENAFQECINESSFFPEVERDASKA